MAGHNKWKQIKHKKESQDKKKSQLFSKILSGISKSAREDPDPKTNSQLKALVDQAKNSNVPNKNIEAAIERTKDKNEREEKIVIEAYGPSSTGIIIKAATDNKNRTVNEMKQTLKEEGGKWADPGSVMWMFKTSKNNKPEPNYKIELKNEDKKILENIINKIKEHPDVENIYTNSK